MAQQKDANPRPFDLINVRVHRCGWERLGKVAEKLEKLAEAGVPIPIKVELGRTHLFDVAVDRLVKELKLNV